MRQSDEIRGCNLNLLEHFEFLFELLYYSFNYIHVYFIFRFMFGLEFLGEEQHKFAFLVVAWKALAIKQFWKEIWCHSLERYILMVTACGRIMIQNTPASRQRNGWKTMVLSTGSHLLNHL